MTDVTLIISEMEKGGSFAAERLLPLVYDELRKLAAVRLAKEKPGQTLQATALVHEAYLRLVDGADDASWNSRGHFFGAAAEAMRRILIEQARRKKTLKAGGDHCRVALSVLDAEAHCPEAQCIETQCIEAHCPAVDILALDEALEKLEAEMPRKAALVKLRFFSGLTVKQAAEALGISHSTADADWTYAKCWLQVCMGGSD